jgi:hypothetical protein
MVRWRFEHLKTPEEVYNQIRSPAVSREESVFLAILPEFQLFPRSGGDIIQKAKNPSLHARLKNM